MWGISILADFRPIEYQLSCCGSLGLGKNLLVKSALGHCVLASISGSKLGQIKSYRLKSLYITDLTYLEQQSG